MIWFYLHVGLMSTATGLLLAGMVVAMACRRRRWWLKAHRRTAACGSAAMAAGFLAAFLLVSLAGQPHFGPPHAWLGGLTVTGAFSTLTLGFLQFRLPARGASIRRMHRVSGRLTAILVLAAVPSGLLLIGLL